METHPRAPRTPCRALLSIARKVHNPLKEGLHACPKRGGGGQANHPGSAAQSEGAPRSATADAAAAPNQRRPYNPPRVAPPYGVDTTPPRASFQVDGRGGWHSRGRLRECKAWVSQLSLPHPCSGSFHGRERYPGSREAMQPGVARQRI